MGVGSNDSIGYSIKEESQLRIANFGISTSLIFPRKSGHRQKVGVL
jgi:hypothetical protein